MTGSPTRRNLKRTSTFTNEDSHEDPDDKVDSGSSFPDYPCFSNRAVIASRSSRRTADGQTRTDHDAKNPSPGRPRANGAREQSHSETGRSENWSGTGKASSGGTLSQSDHRLRRRRDFHGPDHSRRGAWLFRRPDHRARREIGKEPRCVCPGALPG